ncbi:MAG: hypothetical protein SGJ02_05120, partial [bacterium]|nr:hypothetical protein [bacterium]
ISFFVLRKVEPATGWHFNFLFLGIGFTLMESAAIVRLALLFGSTWIVNAVVFSAVLLMIYLANLTVMYGKAASLKSSWLLLFIAIFLNYLIPVSSLTGLSLELRYLTSGLLIGIPVFAAASCFSHLFDKQKSTAYPLGINLIGAMSGGMIEYLSMAIGMQAIWLVVVGVYGLAWITSRVKGTR